MSNTSKILKLLKDKPLTSKEIAHEIGLTENDTRVYLNRLKKKNKIEVIDKRGRYKVYSITKKVEQGELSIVNELQYDLKYLYNLMGSKFKIKENTELSPEDITFLEKIKNKIKKNDLVDQIKKEIKK